MINLLLAFTLFTNQVPSSSTGTDPWEFGSQISNDAPGKIIAIRFYKIFGDTSQHIGHIWSSTGVQLASVVFLNESDSGWQEQSLVTPIFLQANSTWVVSVNSPRGSHYAIQINGFLNNISNDHLKASQRAGLYGLFPGLYPRSFTPNIYFRDVVFIPDLDSNIPTITINEIEGSVLGRLSGFQVGVYTLTISVTDQDGKTTSSSIPITVTEVK